MAPTGDAVAKQPTLEEQMAEFKGFSTVEGAVAPEKPAQPTSTKPQNAAETAEKPAAAPKTALEKLAALDSPRKGQKEAPAAENDDVSDETDADEADSGQTDTDEVKEERRELPKPAKNDAQKRISQAVARQRAAERERDALARRLEDVSTRLARVEGGLTQNQQRGSNKPASTGQDAPPDPKDYEYGDIDSRYISDLARYVTRKELSEAESRRARAQQEQQATSAQQQLDAKMRDFVVEGSTRYDDFNEVVIEGADNWALSPILASLLVDSDHGTDIAYYLAKNPSEARKVFNLTPAKQAAWFGQREAKLSHEAADVAPSRRVSQAPEAPRHVARGSGSRTAASPDTTDFAAFERMATKKA